MKHLFLSLCTIALLAGCAKTDEIQSTHNNATPIKLTCEISSDDTRTTLGSNGRSTIWEAADCIGVFSTKTNNAQFSIDSGAGTSKAVFVGTLNGTPRYAYYPYSAANSDATAIAGNIPSNQTQSGTAANIAAYDYKYSNNVDGNADGYTFKFNQLMTLLHFQIDATGTALKGDGLQYIEIGVAGRKIAGDFTCNITDDGAVTMGNTSSTASLRFAKTPIMSANKTVDGWLFINPDIVAGDELVINVCGEAGMATIKLTTSKSYQRGYKYDMPLTLFNFDSSQITYNNAPAYIPDKAFRQLLSASGYISLLDTNNDSMCVTLTSTGESATTIDCSQVGSAIQSVIGIEYFSHLTSLNVSNTAITSLDVSNNTALTTLDVSNNTALTTLDVSDNTALTSLNVSNTAITSLDVSNNTALTTLNVSNNTALTSLDVSNTVLTSLNISNTSLKSIVCSTCVTANGSRGIPYIYNYKCYLLSVFGCSANWSDAKTWCGNYGTGWYLPTLNELITICSVKSTLNASLAARGFPQLGAVGYWSSTAVSDSEAAGMSFSDEDSGATKIYNKNIAYAVRAVLAL